MLNSSLSPWASQNSSRKLADVAELADALAPHRVEHLAHAGAQFPDHAQGEESAGIRGREHDHRDDRVEKPRQRQPEYAATDVEHLAHELGLEPAPQLQKAQAGDHACRQR